MVDVAQVSLRELAGYVRFTAIGHDGAEWHRLAKDEQTQYSGSQACALYPLSPWVVDLSLRTSHTSRYYALRVLSAGSNRGLLRIGFE